MSVDLEAAMAELCDDWVDPPDDEEEVEVIETCAPRKKKRKLKKGAAATVPHCSTYCFPFHTEQIVLI